ncbi:MAG: hypothetical protein WD046_07225 [Paracoccaceae bacterium]
MPATTAPTGYSRLQIALHCIVSALIAQHYIFKGAMLTAWDRVTDGMAVGFAQLVMAHEGAGALARMRRAQD